MKLLHIIASPRGERSASTEVAHAFIDAVKSKHANTTCDALDVWHTALPEFDGPALDAKYAALEGRTRTDEQRAVWDEIKVLAARFHAADVIVFSVPMWNLGIPYRLKHLIDVVSQKDVLFTFDDRGLLGMLGGRKVVVIGARGVAMAAPDAAPTADFQNDYMVAWANMVGINDVHSVHVEKTLYGPELDHASRAAACEKARALAHSL